MNIVKERDFIAEIGLRDREIDRLIEQQDRLREALEKFGAHRHECKKWETVCDQVYFHGGVACTCGLDAALASKGNAK